MASAIKNTSVIIKRTGEMMLSGWKLLAISCPICHTALLSKSNQTRCPCCDLPVFNEGDERIKAPFGSVENVVNPDFEADNKTIDEPTSLEELKKEYDLKNKKKNSISAKLGEKMLCGWTLLATSCPSADCGGTPLMSLKNGPMVCVGCDKEYTTSNFGELIVADATKVSTVADTKESQPKVVEETEDETLDEMSDNAFDFDDMPVLSFASFATDKDDASYKISQCLMKGWALLDEVCPSAVCNGSVPLMRDQSGIRHCVDCGLSINAVGEKTNGPSAEKSAAPVVSNASHVSKVIKSVKRTEMPSDEDDDDSEEDEKDEALQQYFKDWRERVCGNEDLSTNGRTAAASSAAPPRQLPNRPAQSKDHVYHNERTSASNTASSKDRASIREYVCDVLYEKLLQSSASLEASQSVDKSLKLSELILRLSLAVKGVDSIAEKRGLSRDADRGEETYF